jgi:uncharacterized protein YjcR
MKNEDQPQAQYAYLSSPRCGAKTRSGNSCKAPAMANGRCRMHGGKSTGAPKGNKNAFKHGFYTKDAIANRKYVRWLINRSKELFGV